MDSKKVRVVGNDHFSNLDRIYNSNDSTLGSYLEILEELIKTKKLTSEEEDKLLDIARGMLDTNKDIVSFMTKLRQDL